jgi:hypothetical protein
MLRSIVIVSPLCCAEPSATVSTQPDVVTLLIYSGTPPEYALTPVTPVEGESGVEHPVIVDVRVFPSDASDGDDNDRSGVPLPVDPPNNAMTAADPRLVPSMVHVGLRAVVVVACVNAPAPSVWLTLEMELPMKNPETLGVVA